MMSQVEYANSNFAHDPISSSEKGNYNFRSWTKLCNITQTFSFPAPNFSEQSQERRYIHQILHSVVDPFYCTLSCAYPFQLQFLQRSYVRLPSCHSRHVSPKPSLFNSHCHQLTIKSLTLSLSPPLSNTHKLNQTNSRHANQTPNCEGKDTDSWVLVVAGGQGIDKRRNCSRTTCPE